MNVTFINPFLNAVVKVVKTMAFVEPEPGRPFLKTESVSLGDVTGVVGLTGPVNGSVAVSFSEGAILHIVSSMFGEPFRDINREVEDAVGELSNIICGDARGALDEEGYSFQASIPAVITGKGLKINHTVHEPSVVIPFTVSGDQPFFVESCFEREKKVG